MTTTLAVAIAVSAGLSAAMSGRKVFGAALIATMSLVAPHPAVLLAAMSLEFSALAGARRGRRIQPLISAVLGLVAWTIVTETDLHSFRGFGGLALMIMIVPMIAGPILGLMNGVQQQRQANRDPALHRAMR